MTGRKIVATLCLLGMLLGGTQRTPAEPWAFAVTGDDRTNPNDSPDPTSINTVIFKQLLHTIAARKPRFVLVTVDLVLGRNPVISADLATQFTNWLYFVKTEAPGLTILPVRGNHETKGDADGKLWLKYFKPYLDANQVTYFPQEEGFSYTYSPPDHPQTVVMAVDQYQAGQIHRVNLTQLDQALQTARSHQQTHVFVFSHEMAFTTGQHPDAENMAAFPRQRDEFINLLASHGCEYFFAGHDHFYDWMVIRNPKWPAGQVVNQIITGTAGAPMYDASLGYYGDHHGYDLIRKENQVETFGYMWITVDDSAPTNQVSCTFVPMLKAAGQYLK